MTKPPGVGQAPPEPRRRLHSCLAQRATPMGREDGAAQKLAHRHVVAFEEIDSTRRRLRHTAANDLSRLRPSALDARVGSCPRARPAGGPEHARHAKDPCPPKSERDVQDSPRASASLSPDRAAVPPRDPTAIALFQQSDPAAGSTSPPWPQIGDREEVCRSAGVAELPLSRFEQLVTAARLRSEVGSVGR